MFKFKQKGYGFFKVFVILVACGFLAVYGGKFGMTYYEAKAVKNAVLDLEDTVSGNATASQVKNTLLQQLNINNIQDITDEDITVTKQGSSFQVDVSIVRDFGFNEQIKMEMDLSVSEQINPGNKK